MKKNQKMKLLLLLLPLLVLVACGNSSSDNTIKIGSKDFTENLIVGELYALALEDQGYNVERVSSIASSIIPQAIESSQIDLYPEYTGTSLLSIFKLPLETNPDQVAQTIREKYEEGGVLTTLDYAPANDSAGIAIKTSVANQYKIKTLSDLQMNAENIRFASQGEFDQREDGIPGLEKVYGPFKFKSSKVYDNSLKYQVLKSDEADATPAYTTEGQLSDKEQFTVLIDDKKFWPPYNIVPIVRQDLLKKFPNVPETLNAVNKHLTTETMIKLNASVDIDGKDYRQVAKEFYQSIK